MDDLYLKLGRAIATRCKPGFHQAALLADMEQEGGDLKLTYSLDDGSEWEPELDEDDRAELRTALTEVRHVQGREDGKIWKTCTVVLTRGGGFEMDVGY
jgi:hypothetical protein